MISLKRKQDYVYISFEYNPEIIEEVKQIPGRKWIPDKKVWSVPVESWPYVSKLIKGKEFQFVPNKEIFVRPHLFISNAFKNNLRVLSVSKKVQAGILNKFPFVDKFGIITDKSSEAFKKLLTDDIFISSVKEIQDFITIHHKVWNENIEAEGFIGKLRPFQQIGANHLIAFKNFLLSDEMGLGKTVMAIFSALRMKEKGRVARVLVVCPSPLKYQWAKMIKKFSDADFTIVEGHYANRERLWERDTFFTIVNYETMRTDIEIIKKLHFELVIGDEIQRIKSHKAKTTKALKSLESFYRFALTGTPIENHIGDLFSICEWVHPEILGWWKTFNDRYCIRDGFGKIISYKNLDEIYAKIKGLMLRRTKEEVIDELPDMYENTYFCDLCPETKKIYKAMRDDIEVCLGKVRKLGREKYAIEAVIEKLLMEEETGKKIERADLRRLRHNWSINKNSINNLKGRILSLFTLIMEVCNSAELLTLSDSEIAKEYCKKFDIKKTKSAKVNELLNIFSDIEAAGDKLVVFTKFERMIRIMEPYLRKSGFKYLTTHGKLNDKVKEERLETFKNSKHINFLISTDCLSLGKNIQEAKHSMNFDLPFNPAKLMQRNARICRMDSKHDSIHILYLVSETPAERNILEILFSKVSLALRVLNPKEFELGNLEKLGINGIAKLLGLDKITKKEEACQI